MPITSLSPSSRYHAHYRRHYYYAHIARRHAAIRVGLTSVCFQSTKNEHYFPVIIFVSISRLRDTDVIPSIHIIECHRDAAAAVL